MYKKLSKREESVIAYLTKTMGEEAAEAQRDLMLTTKKISHEIKKAVKASKAVA